MMQGAIPGGRLGLANIAVMCALGLLDFKSAFVVTVLRSFGGCILFGGFAALPYSLSGGIFALIVMALLIQFSGASMAGVGMAGAFASNTAQVLTAAWQLGDIGIIYYLPFLGLVSVGAGLFTGLGAGYCTKSIIRIREG